MIAGIDLAIGLLTIAPRPVGMPIWVQAAPRTAYIAKCHFRTFKDPDSGYVNTYYIDAHGPFQGTLPSPNAQCVFGKTKGEGLVTLHIFKGRDHSASSLQPGQWIRLEVW